MGVPGFAGWSEIALRIKEQEFEYAFTNRSGGSLGKIVGSDLWKASIGVIVSLVIALGLQPLIAWTGG